MIICSRHVILTPPYFYSNWIKTTAQAKFRKRSGIKDDERLEKYLADARKVLPLPLH